MTIVPAITSTVRRFLWIWGGAQRSLASAPALGAGGRRFKLAPTISAKWVFVPVDSHLIASRIINYGSRASTNHGFIYVIYCDVLNLSIQANGGTNQWGTDGFRRISMMGSRICLGGSYMLRMSRKGLRLPVVVVAMIVCAAYVSIAAA